MSNVHRFPGCPVENLPAACEAREAGPVARQERRWLAGIRPALRMEDDARFNPGALAQVIDQLMPDESIELRYSAGTDPVAFALDIELKAVGRTADEAGSRSAVMSALLDASLELACPHLHFLNGVDYGSGGTSTDHWQEVRPDWWVLQSGEARAGDHRSHEPVFAVPPGGLSLDGRDGERPCAPEKRTILFDARPERLRFPADPLVSVLGQLPERCQVVLRFESVVLSSRDRQTVQIAATRLAFATGRGARGIGAMTDAAVDADDVLAWLKAWQARGRGCRCRCFVVSRLPVPDHHLAMLGQLVFVQPLAERGRRPLPDALDLRGAVPSSVPAIYPFPMAATALSAGLPRSVPSPAGLSRGGGVRLGRTDDGQRVHLGDADRLRHTYVIGATGTGKSTLLLNMIRQDMAAGTSVILIDPHGDLFADVRRCVPRRRLGDLVLLDFADFAHPVAMNMLTLHGTHREIAENFVCNELIRIFSRVLYTGVPEAFGPVFETYFRNALLLLMQGGGDKVTLIDFERVFADDAFREVLLEKCTGRPVAAFWQGIAGKVTHQDYSLKNMAPYIVSKLTQFTSNALIRPIIAQPGSIDFRRLMDEGRIVLINLAKGHLGELDSALLGMLVLGKIYLAALSRTDTQLESRRVVHLYVDEFQNIATESLAAMMSEARKFGLCATLANQSLSQIDGRGRSTDVAGAILANAANLLVFRVGIHDAETLAHWLRPWVSASMLSQLPDFHVAARILRAGRPLPPFVFRSSEPETSPR
ncbi:MAG: type IV secretion system DNA-binding domain-containing protein [Defluviicoccus sp.]